MALAGGTIEKSHYTCHEPRVIVIATGLAAIMYGVRRVGEYSSSFLDLKDCTQHKGIECTPRDRTSQRSDKPPRTANAKEHATNWLIKKNFREHGYFRIRTFSRRLFREGGVAAI